MSANNMETLHSIELPGIYNWGKNAKDRFMVLLSHSISQKSIKEEIKRKKGNSWGKEEYIDLFYAKSKLPRELKDSLYPLEAGNSWDELSKNDPPITEMITPILDELYIELQEKIKVAYKLGGNPYSAFLGVGDRIQNIIEENKNEYDQSKKKTIKAIEQNKIKMKPFDDAIKSNQINLEKLKEKIESIKNEDFTFEYNPELEFEPGEKTVPYFFDSIFKFRDVCISSFFDIFDDKFRKYKPLIEVIKKNEIENILTDAFSSIEKTLNNYWYNSYFFSSSDSDEKSIKDAAKESQKVLGEFLYAKITKAFNKILDTFQQEANAVQVKCDQHEIDKKRIENEIQKQDSDLKKKEISFTKMQKQLEFDLATSKNIKTFFITHFNLHKKNCKEKIHNKDIKPHERFLYLAFLKAIDEEFTI